MGDALDRAVQEAQAMPMQGPPNFLEGIAQVPHGYMPNLVTLHLEEGQERLEDGSIRSVKMVKMYIALPSGVTVTFFDADTLEGFAKQCMQMVAMARSGLVLGG